MKKDGFTLAEVLITLGIIGVVAAMTIPHLMNEIKDRQFKEAAKEAYSKASQAVQQMKQDEGGDLSSYYTTGNSFKPVFIKYFKVLKDCNWRDCVSDSATYQQLGQSDSAAMHFWTGQFVTNDGVFWAISNFGSSTGNRISILVDVNGYQKLPNVYGRDVFMFQLLNDNLVPMGASGTWYPIVLPGSYTCSRKSTYQSYGCMYYVMQGIDY
jgi:prepilin-type N-terminal cleavage/methylation domain-containing protein